MTASDHRQDGTPLSGADALARIEALYDGRVGALARARAAGLQAVGCVGWDAPHELVLAAGLTPVRLCGQAGAVSPLGDALLGSTADGEARSLLHLLLNGGYGPLDRLVIAHDTEALVRIFYIIRAFHKVDSERAAKVPLPYFFDLLHMPRQTTGRYNRVRAKQLNAVLTGWSGQPADEGSLRRAIALCNETRRRLRAVQALRRRPDSPLTGTQGLKVMAAAHFTPRPDYNLLLEALIAGAGGLPTSAAGKRVFVTGGAQDNPDLYDAITAAGGRVVAEDFDWGDRNADMLVDEAADDPLDAIVDRYHLATPGVAKYAVGARAVSTAAQARAAQADVVICHVRNGDPGPRWDAPAQRRALADIPMLLLDDQAYGVADPAQTTAAIAAFLSDPTSASGGRQ